jgi:flagellar basal body L-ring protein FlgH
MRRTCCLALMLGTLLQAEKPKKKQAAVPQESPLDQYVEAAHRRAATALSESPGSLWSSPATLADMAADVRARSVDDIVTVVVQ